MNDKDAFDKLEQEVSSEIGEVFSSVKDDLHGIIKLFGLVGNVIELYAPVLFETMNEMLTNDRSSQNITTLEDKHTKN